MTITVEKLRKRIEEQKEIIQRLQADITLKRDYLKRLKATLEALSKNG